MDTEIKTFVKSIKTWFDIEEENGSEMVLVTRQHGDVCEEEADVQDIEEAYRIGVIIKKKYKQVQAYVETVDEWVHLNLKWE